MKKFVFAAIMVLVCMISSDLLAECTGLSFDPAMDFGEAYDESGNVTGYYPNNLESYELTGFAEETQAGIFVMEFYPTDTQNGDWTTDAAAVGTYDLGTGRNANYSTCNQCVRLYRFVYNPDAATEDEAWSMDKQFFQQEGTLQVKHTDFVKNDHYYYNGIVSVKLAEATISNDGTYTSSFVANGECYEIESAAWTTYPEGSEPTDPVDPADTGDTSGDPVDTGDTGDTEVPGDTDADTAADTEAPADDAPADTEAPADDAPADTDDAPADTDETPADGDDTPKGDTTPAEDDEDDGGCALVTL